MVVILIAKIVGNRSRFCLMVVTYLVYGIVYTVNVESFSEYVLGEVICAQFCWTSERKRWPFVVARVICTTTSHRGMFNVCIAHGPICPGVHGRLRRACKGYREYIMFIDCKHAMQV